KNTAPKSSPISLNSSNLRAKSGSIVILSALFFCAPNASNEQWISPVPYLNISAQLSFCFSISTFHLSRQIREFGQRREIALPEQDVQRSYIFVLQVLPTRKRFILSLTDSPVCRE